MKLFNPKQFTNAPLQMQITRKIDLPAEKIWAILSDHKGMTDWMPMIKSVKITQNDPQGGEGEGCQRVCEFGGDTLYEDIVHWDPPHGYAYMIQDNHMVNNHLGYVEIEAIDEERSKVSWYQYFVPQGNAFKKFMMKNLMMPNVLKKGLKNLENKAAA